MPLFLASCSPARHWGALLALRGDFLLLSSSLGTCWLLSEEKSPWRCPCQGMGAQEGQLRHQHMDRQAGRQHHSLCQGLLLKPFTMGHLPHSSRK